MQWQVFRGSDAVRRDLLSGKQLRGAAWMRVHHDVYADSRLDRDHALACRAFGLRLPVSAVFAGPSAAHLHGVEHAAGFADDVHVIVPPETGVRSRPAMRVHAIELESDEWEAINGLRRTTPMRTVWDVACWSELAHAVGILDRLLDDGLVAPDDLTAIAARYEDSPSLGRALRVFELADARSRSHEESHLRIRLVVAGLPPPMARYPVELNSGRVLHPGVAWPDFRVAVELDERSPTNDERPLNDERPSTNDGDPEILRRYQRSQLIAAGWDVLHVTGQQLQRDFTTFVTDVRKALLGRGWLP
ncbi:hypothetical protein [Phytohabitans rumicis]|uniref:hypothetical protein n=1 Tax=Phytohabitans rumicis TaxID=1076125 RepID=UPI001565ACC1|nr:hypothetical protein [Phytohabitans rumicis]